MLLDLVDVFGSAPMRGNPLGVVRGGEGLSDAQMLALTRWLGFSETTFLVPPTDPAADYAVRIFYPAGELPFAGHPTLGSCHAWLAQGGVPQAAHMVVQQCPAGLVRVRREDDGALAFAAPPLIRSGPLDAVERAEVARIVGVAPDQIVDAVHANNGPGWKLLRLESVDEVLALNPLADATVGTDVGVVAAYPAGGDLQFEVRAFFANDQGKLVEDPVTGSLNAATAQYLFAGGLARERYVAGQGRKVGADGRVICAIDRAGQVWIGGHCAMIAEGGELGSFA
ncbi:MAG: PhzF family phenazine biosynthesis protein [Novosphingobium sp.]|nr:PhzF family phenazine biosynthesis protein [Novosphingobium sp.]